nr:nucleoside monophosphate kinase [Methanobrevibacter sp. TMH8]
MIVTYMNVVGISGLPGSGKSLVSKIAKKRSNIVINMGDLVRKEAKKRNTDVGETAINLRKEQGEYVLAKLTIEKIKNESLKLKDSKNSIFLIEGIRSQFEVKMFKENFKDFILISIFSSPSTRFDRLKNRKRDDDSEEYENFLKRDQRELNFGIGNVIASSDFIIINENGLDEYKNQIEDLFDNIIN